MQISFIGAGKVGVSLGKYFISKGTPTNFPSPKEILAPGRAFFPGFTRAFRFRTGGAAAADPGGRHGYHDAGRGHYPGDRQENWHPGADTD